MTIGYIGLGKMGMGMVLNLLDHKWKVVAYNRSTGPRRAAARRGAAIVGSIEQLVASLKPPRLIWIMVSHKAVDAILTEVTKYAKRGDVIIDGGNSPYQDSIRREKRLAKRGIHFMDVGVSGGPGGARSGACMMVGGNKRLYTKYKKLFRDTCVKNGYGHMGATGSGHFVKMVHNGIEYGMMQAIAEGFAVMKKYPRLDLKGITKVYNHGSVVESRLIGWLGRAYRQYGVNLKGISGKVAHSGEGLWTVQAAKRLGIPVANIKQALDFRVTSQKKPSYTGQVLTALRNQFGHHSKKGDK